VDLGTVRLPRLIGHSRAMDLLLTGLAVGAAEALAMGLVNRVVPDGSARAAAVGLAAELAALPQAFLRNDRLSPSSSGTCRSPRRRPTSSAAAWRRWPLARRPPVPDASPLVRAVAAARFPETGLLKLGSFPGPAGLSIAADACYGSAPSSHARHEGAVP